MGVDNYSYIIVTDTYTVGNSNRIFCGSDNIRYIVHFSVCIFQRCFNVARRCGNEDVYKRQLDKNTYDDDSDTTLLDIIAFSELQDPEAILIDRENMDGMEYKINKVLSKLETEVLVYYLEGLSYQEIAEKLGKDTKAVDNAVQRIKKKLESALREGNDCLLYTSRCV